MLTLLIAALLAGQEAAPPPPGSGTVIVKRADWVARPDIKDIIRVYPKLAGRLSIDGRAIVGCRIRLTGLAENCAVLSETPDGLGFGAAAVQLAQTARFSPELRDGVAVDGGTIRIPINFSVVDDWADYRLNYPQALNCIRWHSARLVFLPNDPLSTRGLPMVEAAARVAGEKGRKAMAKVEADIAKATIKTRADLPRLNGAFLSAEMCAHGF